MIRRLLLRVSRSDWLADALPRLGPVRRAVSRFIPGEELDDALEASRSFQRQEVATVLTRLGEHVEDLSEARAVRAHYLEVVDRCAGEGLPTEISVKLTQLGLERGREPALENLLALARRAESAGLRVWVDMEESDRVDATLDVCNRVLVESGTLGVCLQAYLYRTPDDLEELLEAGATIRLVKGAYDEPADVAFPDRADVDDAFRRLADRLLDEDARSDGRRHAFATHDDVLIREIRRRARERSAPTGAYEIQMLYGIRRGLQQELAREGESLRILISYGPEWFAWYMRRLAERPANLGFLVRNLFGG